MIICCQLFWTSDSLSLGNYKLYSFSSFFSLYKIFYCMALIIQLCILLVIYYLWIYGSLLKLRLAFVSLVSFLWKYKASLLYLKAKPWEPPCGFLVISKFSIQRAVHILNNSGLLFNCYTNNVHIISTHYLSNNVHIIYQMFTSARDYFHCFL